MSVAERRIDRGTRNGARLVRTCGTELREARLAAGLSQAFVASAASLSRAEVSRMERGAAPWLSVVCLSRIAAVLGLEASLRLFPRETPLRDAGHARLISRLRRRVNSSLVWRTEVPLSRPGDPRAWDVMINGTGWSLPVDAETRVTDGQALARRTELKRRDSGFDVVVLLIADTRHNRVAVRGALSLLPDFPEPSSRILAALASGLMPLASGIVLL
jgi:transcriptional regulator with XRE-family HTH domain